MKVSLVSPYPDITNYGLRTLSAVLRGFGHDTTHMCMPDFAGDGRRDRVLGTLGKLDRFEPRIECLAGANAGASAPSAAK